MSGSGFDWSSYIINLVLVEAHVCVESMRRKRIYAVCFGPSNGQHPVFCRKCKRQALFLKDIITDRYTPDEGWKVRRLKRCDDNKDEDKSPRLNGPKNV